jgi:hypothetical protein
MATNVKINGTATATKTTRASVPAGACFMVKKGNKVYANIGQRTVPPSGEARFESINVANGELASSANGKSEVTIVGSWELNVTLTPDAKRALGM